MNVVSSDVTMNDARYEVNSTVLVLADNGISEDILMVHSWLRVVFVVLYSAIFLVGLSGNSLVLFVVSRSQAMQTITNIFIANLAASDIMMCLFAVPFTPAAALLQSWPFGEELCHIVPMTLGVSVHVSTLTSIAIAVDRYCVIVHPFKPRMKVRVCLLLIVAIWVTSNAISLPLSIYQKVTTVPATVHSPEMYICHEHWPKQTARQFFTVTSLVLQYVVPCSLITFCYTRVSIVLERRAKAKAGITGRSSVRHGDREQIEIRRKRRTNRMLIAMVAIFVVCWLPLNMLHVVQEYNIEIYAWHYFLSTFLLTHVIAMSSTIYNPFLYAWMNDNFKKEFQQVLPRCLFSHETPSVGSRVTTQNDGQSQYTTLDTVVATSSDKRRQQLQLTALQLHPDTQTTTTSPVAVPPAAVNYDVSTERVCLNETQ